MEIHAYQLLLMGFWLGLGFVGSLSLVAFVWGKFLRKIL